MLPNHTASWRCGDYELQPEEGRRDTARQLTTLVRRVNGGLGALLTDSNFHVTAESRALD